VAWIKEFAERPREQRDASPLSGGLTTAQAIEFICNFGRRCKVAVVKPAPAISAPSSRPNRPVSAVPQLPGDVVLWPDAAGLGPQAFIPR
jgi:hypothetical protein